MTKAELEDLVEEIVAIVGDDGLDPSDAVAQLRELLFEDGEDE
jgi:hypothetical protein